MRYRLMHPRLSALAALATCALCLPLLANQAEASTASSEPFDTVFTFDGYASGPLGGQQGWETSSDSVTVTTDPASADNNVLEMTGPNLWARHSLPAIQNGNTGTIFFRMWRGALVDASVGLSDVPAPTTFNDFEVQANNQRSATLNARDGSRFSPAGIFAQGAWQCIWMVADNAADHYRMYSLGGPYQSITQLPTETDELFGFRNGLQDTPCRPSFPETGP